MTGFTGSNGFAVVGPDVRRFVTDFRYVEQAKAEVRGLRPRAGAAGAARARCSGLDGVTPARVRRRARVRARAPAAARAAARRRRAGARRRASSRACGRSRSRTRSLRIARRGRAGRRDLRAGCWSTGIVGRTEREVAVALEHEMRLRGASGPSFDSIVASAEHGALPHATPRDVRDRARHAGHDRHRRGARRLLLGLHAHLGDGRRCPDELAEIYALVLRAQVDGPGRRAARAVRARARRRRARHHHRRGPRRALRPRPRARRRRSSRTRRRGWRGPPRRGS